jgi:hypothetical protein
MGDTADAGDEEDANGAAVAQAEPDEVEEVAVV